MKWAWILGFGVYEMGLDLGLGENLGCINMLIWAPGGRHSVIYSFLYFSYSFLYFSDSEVVLYYNFDFMVCTTFWPEIIPNLI